MEQILQLIADGRLSAAEAGPILDALGRREREGASDRPGAAGSPATGPATAPKAASDSAPARAIRIEVRESGRQVVNLRVPLALGRDALARIPGLSESLTDRLREALASGIKGPIVDVDDGGDGVRIIVE